MKREFSDMTQSFQDIPLDAEAINTVRLLAVDMVEKARSGHPGLPLGAAPMACVLFTKIMNHNPANPQWINRDRFVLSAGHGSALLYALLHLTGYDLSLEELKSFRQWGSKTPGHPEYGHTPGVETTTGPLGQGIATAVGMAIAETHCAAILNRDGLNPIDYFTYVICSDGDLMEGISSEASSLAGHLKLGKLICLYDSNRISIEGSTALTFTENVEQRYLAYGWHVDHVDGNDAGAIEKAVLHAKTVIGQPSMIIAKTIIGFGSPGKQNSSSAHGEPLGKEETRLVKKAFGFPEESVFHIPENVRTLFLRVKVKGQILESRWNELWDLYRNKFPEKAQSVEKRLLNHNERNLEGIMPSFDPKASIATRQASKEILSLLKTSIPFLVGGSADLGPSCGTIIKTETDFAPDNCSGTNLHFGVREHAMGAVINGMALSRIIIPYGATFLVFADYMKPALRLAALMKLQAIFLFSHDSIALGEDGPTHQPVEQLAMLRAIPGLTVIRPSDAYETAGAWLEALQRKTPTAIVLSRQTLPVLDPERYPVREGVRKGGYILCDWQDESTGNDEKAIIIASGAEVHIALEARKMLESERIFTRVVSMPSIELFDEQPESYRTAVLPPKVKNRVVVEAASPFGWHKYAGEKGRIVGLDHFGASAPGNTVLREFGFTPEHLVSEIKVLFREKEPGR
ncbi:MAG: transketolase [Chlorobium sp.]|nr:MAG: transketolase [Chlorobium sp.]